MATRSAVVMKVLTGDNYEEWRACMKSYLLAQDLWEIIEPFEEPPNQGNIDAELNWKKRNIMALHAIQMSCDPQLLSKIRNITSARIAWHVLATMHKKNEEQVPKVNAVQVSEMPEVVPVLEVNVAQASVPMLKEEVPEVNATRVRVRMKEEEQEFQEDNGEDEEEGDEEGEEYGEDNGEDEEEDKEEEVPGDNATPVSVLMLEEEVQEINETQVPVPMLEEEPMQRNASASANVTQVSVLKLRKVRKETEMSEKEEEAQVPEFNKGAMTNEIATDLLELSTHIMLHIMLGDGEKVKRVLARHPNAIKARISIDGGTALHQAISSRKEDIAIELTKLMSEEDLEIKDSNSNTALHIATATGSTKPVECMIRKNRKLVIMGDKNGVLPFEMACSEHRKDLARLLYSMTPRELLFQDNGERGSNVLDACVAAGLFDMAMDLLYRSPSYDLFIDIIKKSNLLKYLSTHPEAFPSGKRLIFWQRWIYKNKLRDGRLMATYLKYLDQVPFQCAQH